MGEFKSNLAILLIESVSTSDRSLRQGTSHELGKTKNQPMRSCTNTKMNTSMLRATPLRLESIEDADRIREALRSGSSAPRNWPASSARPKTNNEILYKHEDEYFHAEGDTSMWSLIERIMRKRRKRRIMSR